MTTPNTQSAEPDADEMDLVERTMQSIIHPEAESSDEITNRPRNAAGQFTSQAGEIPLAQPGEWNIIPDAQTDEQGQPIPVAPVIPEGHAAIPTLPPEKVQGFKVLDDAGEILPPDLKFEVSFRDGNSRTMDVPQLVNFARQGVYNHELQQQAIQVRNDAFQWQQRATQADQALAQARDERTKLLTNADYLIAEIERAAQQNTPEARAQREREQVTDERQAFEFERAVHSNTVYLDSQVEPALDKIIAALPTVQKAELAGYLNQLVAPWKVQTKFGTILNPNAKAQIEADIVHRLVPYAMQLHESRAGFAPKQSAAAPTQKPAAPDPKVVDLQARAAKAKRVATAALQPVGGNGQPQGASTPTKAPTDGKSLESFIIAKSMGRG